MHRVPASGLWKPRVTKKPWRDILLLSLPIRVPLLSLVSSMKICSNSGIGSAVVTRCGLRSVYLSRYTWGWIVSKNFSRARMPWICISGLRRSRKTCRSSWPCSVSGITTFLMSTAMRLSHTISIFAVFRPICNSWTWRVTARPLTVRANVSTILPARSSGAKPAATPSMLSSSYCTRAPSPFQPTSWSRHAARIHWASSIAFCWLTSLRRRGH